ncbi:non-homologous end joining protein Ku [Oligoflexus tunisiensis]|uniref:non-homologous end joining protein Ku n=1 Tax=Oligoflexus tunisiensis TaxID=708132 RepID=UPI000AD80D4D|nr:Ku protein [Oligoflexus tunisiensis]
MPANVWKGSISFGLVHIPVSLQNAVREDHIEFRLLEKNSLCQVKYERVCKKNNKTIPWGDIVKGYEYAKDKFVVLTDADFEKAALATSKAFEIEDFVPADQIDSRYFSKPYYAIPEEGAEGVYALLREAIKETDTVGIGRITIRNKQHLAAVRALDDAIEINLMRFADEVVDQSEFDIPSGEKPKAQALKMAKQLIESLTTDFNPQKYKDQYRENLQNIINAKVKGQSIKLVEAEEPRPTAVIDLLERLQASLKRSGTGSEKPAKTAKTAKSTKRAATKTAKRTSHVKKRA